MSSEEWPGVRTVTDARTLRALTHPVRVALLEELALHGAMTATEVGERIGETPTTCSFHLRQLAKYGFVEEAGGGKGRARPWRLTAFGLSLSGEDPQARVAGDAAVRVFRERSLTRYQAWKQARHAYPDEWRDAAMDSQYLSYLTFRELKELTEELDTLLMRFHDRLGDPSKRPPGSVPVETLLFSFPIEPPPAAAGAEGESP